MAYQVYFNKLAFQKTKDGQPTVPDGPEVILNRGELVPEWVPSGQVAALATAGMVVYSADPLPELVPVDAVAEQYRTPDQPAVLPSDPLGTSPVLGDLLSDAPTDAPREPAEPLTPTPANPVVEPLPALPKDVDNKETWEQYATRPQIGMTSGDAEAMTKKDLIAEVKRRHAAATA